MKVSPRCTTADPDAEPRQPLVSESVNAIVEPFMVPWTEPEPPLTTRHGRVDHRNRNLIGNVEPL